ncbi:hypothetical protein LCGC14_0175020 [marine sediment metagenome]|uniref:Uncharacterized protein n=1 Tax=marine sediment metagenome TaxID=412755 RepID=A0A0F9XTM0_9ZZZZ
MAEIDKHIRITDEADTILTKIKTKLFEEDRKPISKKIIASYAIEKAFGEDITQDDIIAIKKISS